MMPDPGSPWERENPGDGFGYLPWPIRTPADRAKWDACSGIVAPHFFDDGHDGSWRDTFAFLRFPVLDFEPVNDAGRQLTEADERRAV